MASGSARSLALILSTYILAHLGYFAMPSFLLPAKDSRRQLLTAAAVTAMNEVIPAAKAASAINGVQVKLYSDDVCDSKRIFENVTADTIPLDSCEKDKSGVAVYYQCTGNNKLHIRVYFRGNCQETPTIEADPINGKCVPLPGFGSGFWTWQGGC